MWLYHARLSLSGIQGFDSKVFLSLLYLRWECPVACPGDTLLIFQVLRKTLLLRVDPPLLIYHLYNRRQLSHSGCSILHILATCTWLFFSAHLHIFHFLLGFLFLSFISMEAWPRWVRSNKVHRGLNASFRRVRADLRGDNEYSSLARLLFLRGALY